MKVLLIKAMALCGLCALFAGAGNTAFAQGYDRFDHHDMGFEHRQGSFEIRQRIENLQREYAHEVHVGNYAAARRVHWRAQQLRERLREHRDFHG